MIVFHKPAALQIVCALACLIGLTASAGADEAHLSNGLVLEGTVLPLDGFTSRVRAHNNNVEIPRAAYWMIDDGVRRYFVAQRQVDEVIPEDQLSRLVTFNLTHERSGRGRAPHIIGSFVEVTDFDAFGRRRVTLKTERGLEHILQGITEITPRRLLVDSTTHDWTIGLDLTAVPDETLDAVIRGVVDPDNPDDRRGIVVFYVQAEMYKQAREELAAIAEEFPEMSGWAEEMQLQVAHVNALRALNEIDRRRAAGQHQLAYFVAAQFPADRVGADVLREARDIVAAYDRAAEQADEARMLLGSLQAGVPDEMLHPLGAMRSAVLEELHPETLPRLDPFLRAAGDDTLSDDQKLALAYSGWVLGPSNAVTDLDDAIRFWEMRFLALEYLRENADPARREDLLQQLQSTEGVSFERVEQMIPRLPLPLEAPAVNPGAIQPVEVKDSWGQVQHRYSVVLPPEYSPHHAYPMIVVLRAEGTTADQELVWWAGRENQPGPTQRRGYVVIAPEYAAPDQGSYEYNFEVHETVLASINDARKRFQIDSERIFLAGHGMGADACFDLGMTHPQVFAGVVPICGTTRRYCTYYRRNAPDLAWYIVTGERDADSLVFNEQHATDLNDMMKRGQDVIYCEFKARGYETYFEELPRIFDWMQLHRRPRLPREFEVDVMRHTDTRFYWLEVAGLPASLAEPIVWEPPRRRRRPVTMRGNITEGNTIFVRHNAAQTTLWLTRDLIDFDERVAVRVNARQVFNDYLSPDLGALLEDLRLRGDRQRLVAARLEF